MNQFFTILPINKSEFDKPKLEKLSHDKFVKLAKSIHGDHYNYDASSINGYTQNIQIKCNHCFNIFTTTPTNHLYNDIGCRSCSNVKISKGETKIANHFDMYKVIYRRQIGFRGSPYKFDFYLPFYDLLIEYDGQQHFKSIDFFGGKEGLRSQQYRDKIKNELAVSNGTPLLRISYKEYNNIEKILNEII